MNDQVSILHPILLPLGLILEKYNVRYHKYADDTQLYLPVSPNTNCSLPTLHHCLTEVKSWMSHNVLQLNDTKTEVIVFGPNADDLNKVLTDCKSAQFCKTPLCYC